ncbi:MAG TPA: BamA/TamA family outer membrane protein [Chitinophagaceae bacterium]|nr:BamA/TamA family outer membrane protein [Chitinophagaceae bacterium]
MLAARPQNSLPISITAISVVLLLASCKVVPKDYPRDKPFVYETNINLEGNFSKEDNAALISELNNQLDDSIRVRTVRKLFYKGFNTPVLVRPPVFDSTNADRSVIFMKAVLNKHGYLRNSISYDTAVTVKPEAKPPQYRTTVTFNVSAGPLFRIDSISHVINNNELQALTDVSIQKSILKKGEPFDQQLISGELNRLVDLYRENGYLKFSFEELAGIWDTLNLAVLRPSFDPFEQIRMLEELRKRTDSPTVDVEVRLRPGYDVDRLKKYFVGKTIIYPDLNILDTTGRIPTRFVYDSNFTFINYHDLFKKKFIAQNIFFKRGDLYNQKRFLNTISRFNQIGAWRLASIEQIPRGVTDTVDFEIYLTPADKYSFNANIEGSFNNSNSIILQENLIGIGGNVQLVNKNFGRSGNRATTTARYTTEVDTKGEFIKTRQSSISHTIIFPKPIPNATWIPDELRENFNTALTFSLANTDRNDFFNMTSLNASWGYNFRWKNKTMYLKIPNIEYAHVLKRDSLVEFLDENPSLKTVFPENGLVVSLQQGFSIRGGKGKNSHILRLNAEESGLLTSYLKLKVLDSLFKFVKFDTEFIMNIPRAKTSWILRGFAGVGYAMTTTDRPANPNLPFFKQFSAGGPYSMRAWGAKTLGPGSTIKTRDSVPIRFGDFQFEANVEYRFPLFKIGGYSVTSCLFTDIGNVWFIRKNPDFPDGTLTAERFLKDLAVGMGTGLRFDFQFFRLRLDYGVKVRNPSPEPYHAKGQYQWFYNFDPFAGIIQLGINYPFAF